MVTKYKESVSESWVTWNMLVYFLPCSYITFSLIVKLSIQCNNLVETFFIYDFNKLSFLINFLFNFKKKEPEKSKYALLYIFLNKRFLLALRQTVFLFKFLKINEQL